MIIDLTKLTYREFEDLIHDILVKEGYEIESPPAIGQDHGRDTVFVHSFQNSLELVKRRYVVQCKDYKRAVGSSDVEDIVDTICRVGGNGFLLAVANDVTHSVITKFSELTATGKYSCTVWTKREIIDRVMKHPELFQKYFPKESNNYKRFLESLSKGDIEGALVSYYKVDFDKTDLERIEKQLFLKGIKEIKDLQPILENKAMQDLLKQNFSQLLKRAPTPAELASIAIYLHGMREEVVREAVLDIIRNSPEFISKARLVINFNSFPKSKIDFDEIDQVAHGFRTYHSNYKLGSIEIVAVEEFYERAVKLSATAKSEFRVVYLENFRFPYKTILDIDYTFHGAFQLFILVQVSDGKLYFIQYVEGKGEEEVIQEGEFTYLKIYNSGFSNGPFLRKDLKFAEDLQRVCKVDANMFLGLFIGVEGELTVYNILLV